LFPEANVRKLFILFLLILDFLTSD